MNEIATTDKYAFEECQNKEVSKFHISRNVPTVGYFMSEKTTPEGEKFRDDLMAIPGVVKVYTDEQQVTVTRGGAYKWSDIEKPIMDVICKHTGMKSPEKVPAFA